MEPNIEEIRKHADEIYSLPHMAFYGRCSTCGSSTRVIRKIRTLETECLECYVSRVYIASLREWKTKHIAEIQQAAEEYDVD